MLRQLYIRNFTLIDTLDMKFYPGFSVITGETGAGKSIILGAINLLLGQRADTKTIKNGCSKCVIEAHFDLSRYDMGGFFEDNDIEFDPNDTILRRELTAAGKSRAFINDTPVPLTTMRGLGQQLIDIHSQHQNLLLNDEDFQLNVVDIIAGCKAQRDDYHTCYGQYRKAHKALEMMQETIARNKDNEDFIRFQHKELCDAALQSGMQEALEQEAEKLSHVEEIKTALFEADQLLNNGNGSDVLGGLKEASRLIGGIAPVFAEMAEVAERMDSCYIELKDIAQEVQGKADNLDFDPQRLEEINNKLDKIYSLQRKHHTDNVDSLIELRDQMEQQLNHMDNSDEELAQLAQQEAKLLDECRQKAALLTKTRAKAANKIEEEMRLRLIPLGIPNVRFAVQTDAKPLAADGGDKVSFLFSANTSTPMQPVAQVASGGEIARVMLSLKAMISGAVSLPTIIFDEIDTGVSGKIAEQMAHIMQEMAQANRQVISITHLPQIAACGTTHYKVYKQETDKGTQSTMLQLDNEQRVEEIAQMLSGADITEAAISNARELLGKA